jgi:AAA+ superfamily predicted ATPase
MTSNTPTQNSGSSVTRAKGITAGALAFAVAVAISFAAVLIGESAAYGQTLNPLINQNIWFVTAALAIGATVVGAIISLLVSLEVINKIGKPTIGGRTEYTLIGAGGLLGTAAAVVVSGGTWLSGTNLFGETLPSGTGESALALAAVAVPFTYVYYKLYTPASAPIPTGDTASDQMEPEVVKERTERWSKEAGVNPAFPPGQGPADPSPGQNQSPPHVQNSDANDSNSQGPGPADDNSQLDDSEMEFNWMSETDVSFDDIGGMEDLKNELRAEVIKPLENQEKAEELGVSAPNIVFHGPPGTGKTYTAQALATELGLPFAMLSGADVQSKWINESATKVNSLFTEAKRVAAQEGGAVVFLDELDSVLKNRTGSGSAHEEDNKVVNEFLNHLEDTKDHNIVFIGATNRLDALDDAGIRSGRIDKKIHVGKPDATAREEILRAQLADRKHEVSETGIAELAGATNGAVAADLELIVNSAAKQVLARDGDVIQWSDVETAVENNS